MCVAGDRTFKATAIDELTLCQGLVDLRSTVRVLWISRLRHTGFVAGTCKIDIGAVGAIILIDISAISIFVIGGHIVRRCSLALTNGTFLTTTEYLEYIATVKVYRSTTPYLCLNTLTTTEYIQRTTQYVHTLLTKDDTSLPFCNLIGVAIEFLLTRLVVESHIIEDDVAIYNRCIDINDDVTVDDTAAVAASIDVTSGKTTVEVIIAGIYAFSSNNTRSNILNFPERLCISIVITAVNSVPLQLAVIVCIKNIGRLTICQLRSVVGITLNLPTLRLNLQTAEVQLQLVAMGVRRQEYTTLIGSIIGPAVDIGIVTATHHLIIYYNLIVEVDDEFLVTFIRNLQTTHVTSYEERTEIGRVWLIGYRVVPFAFRLCIFCSIFIEHQLRTDTHSSTIHIGFHLSGIGQINLTEVVCSSSDGHISSIRL